MTETTPEELGKEFEDLCTRLGIDPDKEYLPNDPKYADRVKISEAMGTLSPEHCVLLGLTKLESLFNDVFNTEVGRVAPYEVQEAYNILTNKDHPTLLCFCELANINPVCIVQEAKKRKAMQETKIELNEPETVEEKKEYLCNLESYRILCNEIKKEYVDLEDNPKGLFDNLSELDILLEKKEEYDSYWIESGRPHMIDSIPLKRHYKKTTIEKLIGAEW